MNTARNGYEWMIPKHLSNSVGVLLPPRFSAEIFFSSSIPKVDM